MLLLLTWYKAEIMFYRSYKKSHWELNCFSFFLIIVNLVQMKDGGLAARESKVLCYLWDAHDIGRSSSNLPLHNSHLPAFKSWRKSSVGECVICKRQNFKIGFFFFLRELRFTKQSGGRKLISWGKDSQRYLLGSCLAWDRCELYSSFYFALHLHLCVCLPPWNSLPIFVVSEQA